MRYFILTLIAWISLFASNVSSRAYEEKLIELRERVNVQFGHEVSYFQKNEGVNHLYDLVFSDPSITEYFGRNALIQAVIIENRNRPLSDYDENRVVQLHDHTILYNYNGSETQKFIDAFDRFQNELNDIEAAKIILKERFPKLIIQRKEYIGDHMVVSNSSHAVNLNTLITVSADPMYRDRLANLDKIYFKETKDDFYSSTISWQKDIFGNPYLDITLSRDGYFEVTNHVTENFLRQYLDIILVMEFRHVEYLLIPEKEVPALINELWCFLTTNNMREFLIEKGVDRFKLTERYESEEELFSYGKLTMGLTREDMQRVVDVVFGE